MQAARKYYRRKWQEMLVNYFKVRKMLVEKKEDISHRIDKIHDQLHKSIDQRANQRNALLTGGNVFSKDQLDQMAEQYVSQSPFGSITPEKVMALQNEERKLLDDISVYRTALPELQLKAEPIISEFYDPDVIKLIQSYVVEDPYQLLFGSFLLMDEGDDLMWLYGISLKVVESASNVLPWTGYEYPMDDPVWDNEINEDTTCRENPWLKLEYSIGNEDLDVRRINPAQILYECTGTVIPRLNTRYDCMNQTLDLYAVSKEKQREFKALFNAYGTFSHRYNSYQISIKKVEDKVSSEKEKENQQLNQLKS